MDNATSVLVATGITLPDAPTPSRTHSIASSSQSQSAARRPATRSKLLGLGSSSKSSAKSSSPPKPISRAPSKKADEAFVCQICFNDAPGLQTLALDCDHAFCTECWLDYTTSKIREESEHTVRCMAESCALVAPDTFLRDILLGSVPTTEEPAGAREDLAAPPGTFCTGTSSRVTRISSSARTPRARTRYLAHRRRRNRA